MVHVPVMLDEVSWPTWHRPRFFQCIACVAKGRGRSSTGRFGRIPTEEMVMAAAFRGGFFIRGFGRTNR